jgi:hypothetical protein
MSKPRFPWIAPSRTRDAQSARCLGYAKPRARCAPYASRFFPRLTASAASRLAAAAAFLLCLGSFVAAQSIERIDGYGSYRFGMSFAEADAVHNDDTRGKLRNDSYLPDYLSREATAFGERAELLAMFDKHSRQLAALTLRFNRYDASSGVGECVRVLKLIEQKFTEQYGTRNLVIAHEPGGRTWTFAQGGVVSITNLCVGADKGAVAVSFRP